MRFVRGTSAVALVGAAIAVWIAWTRPEAGTWTQPVRTGSIAALALLLAAALVRGASRRRTQKVHRIAGALRPHMGPNWNDRTGLKAQTWKRGRPTRLMLSLPHDVPDHRADWRMAVQAELKARTGAHTVSAEWLEGNARFLLAYLLDAATAAAARAHEAATVRLTAILGRFLGDTEVNVTAWADTDGLDDKEPGNKETESGDAGEGKPLPTAVTASVPPSLTVTNNRLRVMEANMNIRVGGRWKAFYDGINDTVEFARRKELEDKVPHPGLDIYRNSPYGMLYYAKDEDGNHRGWLLGRKSTMPHMLCAGATGGGKTTLLRSLLAGAVLQGIPVYACDPKRVELRPFQGFPGVGAIASTAEHIELLIQDMADFMYARYEAIEHDPTIGERLYPVLFIVDEFMILNQLADKLKKQRKEQKLEQLSDGVNENIQALLALARTAQVHIVIGTQRPDASLFGDGARDNLKHRASLMALSPQASQMMFGNHHTGIDLPLKQGRCIANFEGGAPVEAQTYWLSEPTTTNPEDKAVIDAIRAVAARNFEGFQFPIDGTRFDLTDKELSEAGQRVVAQAEIPLAYAHQGNIADQLMSTTVQAGCLVPDDRIRIGSRTGTVTSIVGDASVLLGVAFDDGDTDQLGLDDDTPIDRLDDLHTLENDFEEAA